MLPSTTSKPLRVFVADDDADMRASVCETLEAHGYATQAARDGEELLDQLLDTVDHPANRPDVIVADVKMPRLSGLGVLVVLRRACWGVPVVMITGMKDESVSVMAKRNGAVGVLKKPFDADDLVTAVQNARALQELHRP
jgi:FixJ family two-component response regulator